tara:strand:+ start:742 stop:2085 length:1344 start_codon:yes stop_codon:yes gene_type:complete
MSSTYSDRLKLELMATGANANTWGTNTNNNLEVVDAFAAGFLAKSVAGSSNITLTTANASDTAEASNKTIELTGALTGAISVFIPAVESQYTFFNNTSGSHDLKISATGHDANGVVIAQGAKTTVFCDGASNFNVEIASSTDAAALGSGTLPDGRFPATLPAASGANLTSLNATNLGSGTVPDARFPATLPAADGSALTALNASNIASGTLGDARLPTVPTSKGGTGLTSIGSAGEVLKVNSGGNALEFGDAGGGGNYIRRIFTSPGTWTYDSTIQAIKVTVVGGGGNGGTVNNPDFGGNGGSGGYADEYISAPSLSAPVAVTVGSAGGTSSYGSFLSASGGTSGGNSGGTDGNAGNGSGGDINEKAAPSNIFPRGTVGGCQFGTVGNGMVMCGVGYLGNYCGQFQLGSDGEGFGGGGRAACARNIPAAPGAGGSGAPGVVIVEEFY